MGAKIIKEINHLKKISNELSSRAINPTAPEISGFIFEYLIDCIKILIFFENYIKAELMLQGFCVHKIRKELTDFEALAKKQSKEPVTINEINQVDQFLINDTNKTLFHKAIKETTLGMHELTSTKKYLLHYKFSPDILTFIKEINSYRNKLHFQNTIEFSISDSFIYKIEEIIKFVNTTIARIK